MIWGLDQARALAGLLVLLGLAWLMSENRRGVHWRGVLGGLALQSLLLCLLFAVPGMRTALMNVNQIVTVLSNATRAGTSFVFGYVGGAPAPFVSPAGTSIGPIFFFQILPFIVVVAAISAMLWHWGILQRISNFLARIFEKTLGLGGAISLAAASNVFLGMVESAIVIGRYFNRLTRAELFIAMVTGLSTVAGTVLLFYALLIRDVLPNATAHLVAASLVAAPAGVVMALLMVPETPGTTPTGREEGDQKSVYRSTIDAFSTGVEEGLRLMMGIAAMIIAVLATVALIDMALKGLPHVFGIEWSLEKILGYAFAPFMWLIGVPWSEAVTAGGIMGAKITQTEIVGFIRLANAHDLSERTRAIMIYCVCGFANFAAMGIMLAGMSTIAPERRGDIISLLFKSLVGGTLANLSTGALVAMLPVTWIGLN